MGDDNVAFGRTTSPLDITMPALAQTIIANPIVAAAIAKQICFRMVHLQIQVKL
jgi:hypothetical protein